MQYASVTAWDIIRVITEQDHQEMARIPHYQVFF